MHKNKGTKGHMTKTKQTFRDKWSKNPALAFGETVRPDSEIFQWILRRNGFQTRNELQTFLRSKKRILDAGCGNGRVTALLRHYSVPQETEVVGVDLVSADIARQNLASYENVVIFEKDLLDDLTDLGRFDLIYCQEVLHHTLNPRKAFHNLCQTLHSGGQIAIYVYKQKAPAREFVDDYIRNKISNLNYEDALKVCEQITELGKVLSSYDIKIKVPNLDVLHIVGGEYDLQRFIYHFFMKCFWNSDLSFSENVVINYDWYHPELCARHTVEEVREWFDSAGLKVVHEYVDFYGITMRGQL